MFIFVRYLYEIVPPYHHDVLLYVENWIWQWLDHDFCTHTGRPVGHAQCTCHHLHVQLCMMFNCMCAFPHSMTTSNR